MKWKKKIMNNYENWCNLIEQYTKSFNISIPSNLECSMKEASFDSDNKFYVYNYDDKTKVLNLDIFCKNIYYNIYGDSKKSNTVNSTDAFLINKDNHWFLIEFKNSAINSKKASLKDGIFKKGYSSCLALMDVLYYSKNTLGINLNFDYENPINFFKNNVTYIVVCSKEKNAAVAKNNLNYFNSTHHYSYTPPFLSRLKSYLFKDAIIYTEEYFEREFVKSFCY